jgi:hypothetical protein
MTKSFIYASCFSLLISHSILAQEPISPGTPKAKIGFDDVASVVLGAALLTGFMKAGVRLDDPADRLVSGLPYDFDGEAGYLFIEIKEGQEPVYKFISETSLRTNDTGRVSIPFSQSSSGALLKTTDTGGSFVAYTNRVSTQDSMQRVRVAQLDSAEARVLDSEEENGARKWITDKLLNQAKKFACSAEPRPISVTVEGSIGFMTISFTYNTADICS